MADDVFGSRLQGWVADIGRGYNDLEGRNRGRQPEPVFVIALLDGRGQDALDSDAIAAHDHGDFLAVLIQHARTHGLGIFVTQFENVPDLDGGIDA